MADSREPPPLFNDDDDSHKDDDNDDLFTSAVQSPVSEVTTPEESRRQEGPSDPLTSPSPVATLTPDPPSVSQAGGDPTDLFESAGEPPVGGLSSVSLESPTGGEGTQQVSSQAQEPPALLHLASSSNPTNQHPLDPSLSSVNDQPLSTTTTNTSLPESSSLSSTSPINLGEIAALASPFSSLLSTFPQDSVSPSIVEDANLDFNFGQPLTLDEGSSDPPPTSPLKESNPLTSPMEKTSDIFTSPSNELSDPLTSLVKEPSHPITSSMNEPSDSLTSALKASENVFAFKDPFSVDSDTQDIFSAPPPTPVDTTHVPEPVVSSKPSHSSLLTNIPATLSSPSKVAPNALVSSALATSNNNNNLLDLGMNLSQELPSDPDTTLVDAPCLEPAEMSSSDEPKVVDTNDVVESTDVAGIVEPDFDVLPPANNSGDSVPVVSEPSVELSSNLAPELDPTNLNMHDSTPAFLDDGETTEISLDETAKEVSLDDEVDDNALFNATSAPKLLLNQDATEPPLPASSILPPMGAPLTPPVAPITPTVTPNLTPNVTPAAPAPVNPIPAVRQSPEEIEAEGGDEFIEIHVSDPQKIGDGMSSYMAYKVTTKTNISYFRKKNWSVTRRFSDFLGLHGKLVEKHLHSGRIIPPAPEKSAIGTTKIKLGSDKTAESGSQDFIERRRASLERFMNRTGAHPTLCADPDFREFVELDAELPKATQTSALSSAGVLRLFNRVGETVNKMTFKMDEADVWFEEKTQQIECLDAQLRKLHFAMEGLVAYRRELAISTAAFSKSTAILSSVEEHSALSRALHQLAESTERTHTIHHAQADADFYYMSEITKDYINLIGAVKDVFHERVKSFQMWQHSQAVVAKKREAKAKAELAGRMDKVQQAQEEVAEWEGKVERGREEFERLSRAIKKEVDRFDVVRVKDFKDMLVKYLEALMTSQQQIIKVWETFMPEAKAIA